MKRNVRYSTCRNDCKKLFTARLAKHVQHPCDITPGLWKNDKNVVIFCLTVNDFGIKYVGGNLVIHLVDALQQYYKIAIE